MAQRFTMNITNSGFEDFTGREGQTNTVYRGDSILFQLAGARTQTAPVDWPEFLFESGADPFDVTTTGGVVATISSRASFGANLISTTDVPGQGTKTGTINVGSGHVER